MSEDQVLARLKAGDLSVDDVLAFYRDLKGSTARRHLSVGQKGLWLLHKLDPESDAYNVPVCFKIPGPLDAPVLRQAFDLVVSSNPLLSSVVVQEEGVPYLVARPPGDPWFREEQAAGLQGPALISALRQRTKILFDLSEGPLARAFLLHVSAEETVVLFVFHHIVFDGASTPIFLRALLSTYQRLRQGTAVERVWAEGNYEEFVRWEEALLRGDEGRAHREYWLGRLAGELPVLRLDIERNPAADARGVGQTWHEPLRGLEAATIREFCAAHAVKPAVFFLAAYQVLLQRYSGAEDLVVGVPSMGRPDLQFTDTIGYFVNMLPVRQAIDPDRPFADHVRDLTLVVADALDNAAYPFPYIVRDLKVPVGGNVTPVFQVAYVFQNRRMLHLAGPDAATPIEFVEEVAQEGEYKLVLEVFESADSYSLHFKYDPCRFDQGDVRRLARQYVRVAAEMASAPDRALSSYSLLSASERAQVLVDWNGPTREYSKDLCLHELLESVVRRHPQRAAVTFKDRSLTYEELNARANEVAHELRRQGVKADTVVGLCMERSLEMVVGLWGILKAGGAYLPIEPSYPAGRIQFMLEKSGVQLVLTQSHLPLEALASARRVMRFDTGGDWAWNGGERGARVRDDIPKASLSLGSRHLAYVIYTSGSTGQPKGVMVEHQAAVNRIEWMQNEYQLRESDVVLQKTPFSFDVSVWEFVWPFVVGARLVVAEPDRHKDPEYLLSVIRGAGVTVLHFVPPMLRVMLEQDGWGTCTSLRHVFCSGEALPGDLPPRHYAVNQARLHNLYGPTEAAIDVTYWPCRPEQPPGTVPIGRPIQNIQLYILDAVDQPQPIGCPGQLFIAGDGLARGYLNSPELTRERFVPNPFSPQSGARMYKTGDLARWLPDGNIEFLGRMDNQVKLRGFRIELGEIEAQLVEHPEVRSCIVTAREDVPGSQQLVAYVIADRQLLEREYHQELRAHLAKALPDYMIPDVFMPLEALPVTSNGKIDRKALPPPQRGRGDQTRERVPPRTATERTVCAACASLLGVPEEVIGVEDNFFALGGHSLLVPRLVAWLATAKLRCDVQRVFNSESLAALAAAIDGADDQETFAVPPNLIPPGCARITPAMLPLISLTEEEIAIVEASVPGGAENIQDIYPLAALQEGMLFHHLKEALRDPYVLTGVFSFEDRARMEAFVAALRWMVARHDVLRTAIVTGRLSRPVQVVWRRADLRVEPLTIARGLAIEEQLRALLAEPQSIPLDQAPLVRVRVGENPATKEWLMVFNMHHLIDDATSLGQLFKEIVLQMTGRQEILSPSAPYRGFVAHTLRQAAESDAGPFFAAYLGDVREPTLMFDLREVHADGRRVVNLRRSLDEGLGRDIRGRAKAMQVSPATLFHVGWALVVSACSGRDDVVFGTVMSGRLQGAQGLELDRMLGNFINTLPLRLKLRDRSIRDVLAETERTLRELIRHEQVSLALAQSRSGVQPGTPLFNAILNYRHMEAGDRLDEAELLRAGIRSLVGVIERSNYPVALSVDDLGSAFSIDAQIDRAQDPELVISYLEAAMRGLVQALASEESSRRPALDIDVVPESARSRVLVAPNDTPQVHGRCVHEWFETTAARTPDAVAVMFEGKSLSYAALNAEANRLAHHLRRLGVGPDRRVALCLGRSDQLIVALVAVLKAGGAYVPLDPAYPTERLNLLLADSAPVALLVDGAAPDLRADGIPVLDLRSDAGRWAGESADNPSRGAVGLLPAHVAYVIYTSGSTGTPKGVMVEHRNISRLFTATEAWFDFGADDVWTMFHSFAFDFSVWEIWGALLYGGRLVVVPQATARNAKDFYDLLCSAGVTVLNQTPGAFRQLMVAQSANPRAHEVRVVVFGGEALEVATLRPWIDRDVNRGTQLVNMYGITETTVHVTYRALRRTDVERVQASPIGRPISDLRVYLLDPRGRPVPIGATGEMYVGGEGVARGYLNRPELTAERFLDDPFCGVPSARMYRTGDLARYSSANTLEYLGRNDQQVKVRGFRIELGEIEARLNEHSAVEDVRVVACDYGEDDRRLVAYVVPAPERAFAVRQLARLQKADPATVARTHRLPNGLTVFHQNGSETDFLYQEIFTELEYQSHGITLRDGDCIFNVGANIGMFTLFAAQRCPNATIYAFEPIPPVFESLRQNAGLYGLNTRLYQCGLAAKRRQETFTFYRHNTVISSSRTSSAEAHQLVSSFVRNQEAAAGGAKVSETLLDQLVQARLDSEQFVCELTTVSDVIRENQIQRIDLLKVDVENAEYDVLQGIRADDWSKIQQVVVEVHDVAGRLDKMLALLEGVGFQVTRQQDNRLLQNTALYNLYAVRRSSDTVAAAVDVGERAAALRGWWDESSLIDDLQAGLRSVLPDYMIPVSYVMLDQIPLTENGKLDYRALPAPESKPRSQDGQVAPRSDAERLVAGVCAELLQIGAEKLSVASSFFALGGNSLLVTRLVSRLQQKTGIEVPIQSIFDRPTIEQIAVQLEARRPAVPEALSQNVDKILEQLDAVERMSERELAGS